jgi:succinyl-CoA synthetase beta subunit
VRLEGTNVELGRSIIEGSGVPGLQSALSMRDGARKIVELAA